MARKITERERILNYFISPNTPRQEIETLLEDIRIIVRAKYPAKKAERKKREATAQPVDMSGTAGVRTASQGNGGQG